MENATMKIKIKKSEPELKPDVLADLKCQHGIKVADIDAFVRDWAWAQQGGKWNVMDAAKWVANLKSIAGRIEIELPPSQRRTDKEIAATAANQINLSSTMPKGTIEVTVHGGWIILEGEVESYYQKAYAENATEHLAGVKGVVNQITIKPTLASAQVKTAIKFASEQNTTLLATLSQVKVAGKTCGNVHSYAE
jgi:hypothetical protein